jgi:TolA-binding protein
MKKLLRISVIIAVLAVFSGFAAAQPPELEYDYGYKLFLNNNFSLADTIFNSFITTFPEARLAGNAVFMSGETEYNTGDYRKALASYISIIEKYPSTKNKYKKELYYRIAECYFQLKDYVNSTKYINLLLREYPESYLTKDAYLLLGENLFLTEDYDGAINALNRMESYTDYSHFDYVYYLKGRIYYEKAMTCDPQMEANLKESIRYFDRVKTEYPASRIISHSEFRKANALYALKQYDSSIKIINSLITKESDQKLKVLMKYFLAWNYYMTKQYKRAAGIYDDIIANYPDDLLKIWSEYKRGLCLEALGDPKGAMNQYRNVITKYPDTVPAAYAQYAIAQSCYNQKDYYGAINEFDLVMTKYNVDELTRAAQFMTADIDITMNNFSRAREIYAKITAANDKDRFTAAYMTAWCMYKEADYDASIAGYQAIISDEKAPEEMKAKATLKIGDDYYELGKNPEAQKYYDSVAASYAKYGDLKAEALYGKGWIQYTANDFNSAMELFNQSKKSAETKETRLKAEFMRANTLYSQYKFDAALAIYTAIMDEKSIPQSMREDSVFYAGWCEYRKQNFTKAVALWVRYRESVSDPVKKAEAQFRIGWAFFRQNDFERSVAEFKVILDNYKSTHLYQEALLKTGDSYYNMKDYNKAIDFYKELVDKFPQHYRIGEALYGIQWSYYQLNEPDKAIELSKQFVDKYPDSSFTPEIQYRVAEHYFNTGNFSTAVKEFEKFIEKNPKNDLADNAYYWLGVSYLNIRDYGNAVTALKTLLLKFPATLFAEKALFKTAGAYYQLHDYTNAAVNYLAFTDKYKSSQYMAEAYFNLAMSYKRNNDIENTKIWYKKLIAEYKDSPLYERAHMNLGYLLQDNKEYDAAIEVFRQVVDARMPKAVEAQFWIADCFNSKKDLDGAAKEYIKVYENYKGEELWAVSALDAAGKIYEKKGDLKAAISMYKKILTATKQAKYTETAQKKIELLKEQYRLLNPADETTKVKEK